MRLYCATTNPGKLREFRLAAERYEADIAVDVIPGLGDLAPCEETGNTFEANAIQKALYYSRFVDDPVFADDSGLAVDALGGAPGVRSARYAGENATDADNNHLLLERMVGVAERAARFVCVVALARQGRLFRTFRGEVEGVLLEAPRGIGGFGYDSIFLYPPFGRTLAEASLDEKLGVSHRGRALAQMFEFIALGGQKSRPGL